MEIVSLADLQKLDIRIGKVLHAERIADTNKLIRLEIDFGVETRQVITGMAEFFEPSHFIGKEIPVIVNLSPRNIQGIESQGMILAVEAAGRPVLLYPEQEVPPGSMVR
ncbi:MAG: methionine--tRNA ligase [Candidatus Wildermuthbacteria bacterium]|nr:methionine--tRNA ligase [Candidatus Wildermuthbacteria bacterium]